jgi:hypothetical protein
LFVAFSLGVSLDGISRARAETDSVASEPPANAPKVVSAVAVGAPLLSQDLPTHVDEGHITLSWREGAGAAKHDTTASYELEQSETADFVASRRVGVGADTQSFVSGLPSGSHYFRIRHVLADGARGPWSKVHSVEVVHHPLGLSIALMAAGAIVFLLTTSFIVTGGFGASKPAVGVEGPGSTSRSPSG